MQSSTGEKRQYSTPRLTVHGTLDEVTKQGVIKQFGFSDGVLFAIPGGIVIGPIGQVS
jgi:hypothetical protein